jgi:23S rRNA pseudouridine1911/1915/1917 synthase
VHRLDKETSGVIVAAKTDAAFESLARQFAERETRKTYFAMVSGIPKTPAGRIDAPIGRHPVHRLKMTVRQDGRSALSEWEVEKTYGLEAALCRIRIHTGRTHQIRVHMASVGHPLLGDALYGYRPARHAAGVSVPRILLHAWELAIKHPVSLQPMAFQAPLPTDFEVFPQAR